MRIPLNYYQILGIPESSLSELEQAYQDRLCQMPQQEYSDAAIESRRQLISLAYRILKDPQQRHDYETQRNSTYSPEIDPTEVTVGHALASSLDRLPDLEISPEHFLGGLLILLEAGEYEEINSICIPYLGHDGRSSNSGNLFAASSGNLQPDANGDIESAVPNTFLRTTTGGLIPIKPDIVLTMAFSLLELGDREWRDSCYEAAVSHFETARSILAQEDLFPQIQGQVERRLDRLRPYRISYLVALPVDRYDQRHKGIQFLEELLQNACSNELQYKNRFGLNSERTIQFIHETLPNLTAGEQSHLFAQIAEAFKQVTAESLTHMQLACTYLHVHALMAQGFAYHNPQLIYRAQQILLHRLDSRLDVSIEQAICAVLIGQTEVAEAILRTAPQSAASIVIRQQSQGLPSQLRGLCWYIESWLKDEAFLCFRDLVTSDPSLHAYFSDPDVQDFADKTSSIGRNLQTDQNLSSWSTASPQLIDVPISGDLSGTTSTNRTPPRPSSLNSDWQSPEHQLGSGIIFPAERVGQISELSGEVEPINTNVIQLERERLRRRPSLPTARTIEGQIAELSSQQIPLIPEGSSSLVPISQSEKLASRRDVSTGILVRRRRQRRKLNTSRVLFMAAGGLAAVWGSVLLVSSVWQQIPTSPLAIHTPAAKSPALDQLSKPFQTPVVGSKSIPIGLLSKDTAQQLLETWFSAKAKSLGREFQTDGLKDILVEPALSEAIDRTANAKVSGGYTNYQYQTTVASVSQTNPLAKIATVEAQVKEDAQYYDPNQLTSVRSSSKKYLVRYNLIRQDTGGTDPESRWYVKQIDIIKQLR